MFVIPFIACRPARRVAAAAVPAALALMVVLGGCGSDRDGGRNESGSGARADRGAVAAGAPVRGGRITIGVQQEPERLSEILNATAVNNLICGIVFSKFVKYDDELRLVPDLIEEIPTVENGGISPDHLTYTYRLKRDARWHDGVPLTSADVAFTYRVIMDPAVNVESREGWDAIASVETPDERTVVFHLARTFPDFVSEIFFDESVLPEHILEGETGGAFQRSRFTTRPWGRVRSGSRSGRAGLTSRSRETTTITGTDRISTRSSSSSSPTRTRSSSSSRRARSTCTTTPT